MLEAARPAHVDRFGRVRLIAAALMLLAPLALLAPSTLAAPAAARADFSSVTFEQRDYTVSVETNGDVDFVEHWQVHFTGGPFHQAFLRLYLASTTGIDFGTVAGATAGSQQVTRTTDASGNPMMQVAWDFAPAQDADRRFRHPIYCAWRAGRWRSVGLARLALSRWREHGR